jgi:hypothetical protein
MGGFEVSTKSGQIQLIAPTVVIVYLVLVSFVPDSFWNHYLTFILTYFGLILGLRGLNHIKGFIGVRRALIDLRALSHDDQDRFLKTVWPRSLRREYLRLVDLEETYTTVGKDALFPFPEAERRLHRWLASALCLFVACMTLVLFQLNHAPFPIRVVPAVLAALGAVPAAWLIGRLALLETTLHVTPFTVSISRPGMPKQAIAFNQPLFLVNVPARGYFELQAPAAGRRLRIHHARIGALHAYALVVQYAALEPVTPPSDAAT